MRARCSCGSLRACGTADALFLIACHCTACQRRTGAPFGAGVYYSSETVSLSGDAVEFDRVSDAGNLFRTFFCPGCGGSLYWTIDGHPELIGVAAGMIDDLPTDVPIHSRWERSKKPWATTIGAALHSVD